MITRLDLQDFRGFEKLSLDGLARVNLIVGGNNTGKTSILEAIALLAKPRDVISVPGLFRPVSDPHNLVRWLIRNPPTQDHCTISAVVDRTQRVCEFWRNSLPPTSLGSKGAWPTSFAVTQEIHLRASPGEPLPFGVGAVHRLSMDELNRRLGELARVTGAEETVDRAMTHLDPRISRVRLVPVGVVRDGVILDVGLKELIPVTQVGEGVARFLGLLSGIISPGSELSLVDEIENGIHTRAMPNVWKALASAVGDFGVQLFATTHSLECVLAAHEAYLERERDGKPYELRVIQLALGKKGIVGRVLDKDDVRVSAENEIDVR